ncbi:MAG: hypothetical protein NC340_07675 [Ruminococcus flavefaciens]|nr:hypothetical protein [Ruminococcus flavefaciens]MCM1229861.1 hypothetical protein [Ruminococcus flavefaciens]
MNSKKDKIISECLNNLSDEDVEIISQQVPALSNKAQKRILADCMRKLSAENPPDTDDEQESVVSGTEKYTKPHIIRYISAAACFIAIIGTGGIIFAGRNNVNPTENSSIPSAPQLTALSTTYSTTNKTAEISTTGTSTTIVTTVGDVIEAIAESDDEPVVTVSGDEIEVYQVDDDSVVTTVGNEITEPATEIPTEETTTESTEGTTDGADNTDYFVGKYTTHIDSDSGNEIIITKTDENTYHVEVKLYRIAYLSDGIGSVNDGILTFTTGSLEGCPKITAEITLNDDGCLMKIIDSEQKYLPADDGDGLQYYRITQ